MGGVEMDLYVISGITGMTGSELARQILKSGEAVIGFDNFFASSIDTIKDCIENSNLMFYEYDLNNREQMEQLKEMVIQQKSKYRNLHYINCAAVVHTEHFYHVERTYETNVLGMKNFLGQAIEVLAEDFINCSTSEVYSMQSWKPGGINEEDFLVLATAEHSQRTSYAVGKLLTEFFMKDAVTKGLIKGCSIRFANVYSRNELYAKHIIPHILKSLIEDGEITLLENAKTTNRSFLHNIDSCSAVLSLVKNPNSLDGSIYNVATEEEISIIDLVELCATKLCIKNPKIFFEGYRESDPERRVLNTDKIRSKTSWVPTVGLDRGIDMCIQYMKKVESKE